VSVRCPRFTNTSRINWIAAARFTKFATGRQSRRRAVRRQLELARPIWLPMNFLLIESLQKFHHYYGDDFKIECPAGSGNLMTIAEVAEELSRRLVKLFQPGVDGQRPVLKCHPKLATDPHFRDYILFHEYFHGDTGRGVGAAHQTVGPASSPSSSCRAPAFHHPLDSIVVNAEVLKLGCG